MVCIPAMKMLMADIFSVPEHSSSPRMRLLGPHILRMVLSSDISMAKVESPLKMSSRLTMRVNICSYGEKVMEEHGTNSPACAMMTAIPMDLMRHVFPTALVPYRRYPCLSILRVVLEGLGLYPREILLATYSSLCS